MSTYGMNLCMFILLLFCQQKFDFTQRKTKKQICIQQQVNKSQQSKCLMDAIPRIIGTTLDIKRKSTCKTKYRRNMATWHIRWWKVFHQQYKKCVSASIVQIRVYLYTYVFECENEKNKILAHLTYNICQINAIKLN